ncbi:MAG TPA: DNA mismatch endonuclease Vsr [Bryobacteraceae bacterium]|nr:DNA mismatch endonuclease Vsr [Bryobacteraceae bacterium]
MDKISTAERSEIMRRVRSKSTGPELTVRSLVHRLGYRFRLHRKDLPGSPDLVFPRFRKVIFVHGCFWHQHHCPRAVRPQSRSDYWNRKLDGNLRRDRKNKRLLGAGGWGILVIWECQIKPPLLPALGRRIVRFLETP